MVHTIKFLLGAIAAILLRFPLPLAFRTSLLQAKCLTLRVQQTYTSQHLQLNRVVHLVSLLSGIYRPVPMLTLLLTANSWMREPFRHHQVFAMLLATKGQGRDHCRRLGDRDYCQCSRPMLKGDRYTPR